MRSIYRIIIHILLSLSIVSIAHAVTPALPERPSEYVVDLANIIDNTVETRLNGLLRELEQKTGTQMIILTISSLDGEPIEEFSLKTAEKWKLGQKGVDNGVLVTVALKDRKYRFEIGYGLEGTLPDSFVGTLGRRYLVPYFRKGNYSLGLYYATLAIIDKIAKDQGVSIGEAERKAPLDVRSLKTNRKMGIFEVILGLVFFIVAAFLFIRHPALFMLLLLSSGGRGWRGGGGFGGGGFGGGGGGGFGGGGASGGW